MNRRTQQGQKQSCFDFALQGGGRHSQNLRVYQLARELVKDVYLLQNTFPKEERYALGDQIRRAAVSITANLAEPTNE